MNDSETKYYKAFDKNLKCRDMQYEIGKEYTFDGEPIPCEQGFHFCKSIVDCYKFYDKSEDTRICEIMPLGKVETDDGIKYCTNKIKILKEMENPRLKSNISETSSGYCNSGNRNSGDDNTGDYNTGDQNSGDYNTGDGNTGNCNSGDYNTGDWNSGDYNTGDRNSGDYNAGSRNTGNRNSGDYNTGYWNSGDCNVGIFNTNKNPKIKIFDCESDWTIMDWLTSEAYGIMLRCPFSHSDFVPENHMTDEEKENHPEYKTIGGYIETFIVTKDDKQKWWDCLSDKEKEEIYSLPNFDADKFEACTGIKVKI
jgi:hypothetical protein